MYTFNILIEKIEERLSRSRMVHIMAGMLVFVYGIRGLSDLPKTSLQLYTGIPAACIILYIAIFKKNILKDIKHNRNLRIIEAVFIIMAATHFWKYNFQFVAVSFAISVIGILISIIIEHQLLGGYKIQVSDAGILRASNTNQQKLIEWSTISNAMVKHNILTVDLRNNYLMQSTFTDNLTDAEQSAFNAYCKDQIAKH
jgi:uncharacterized membrane protein